jgi:hypothetical protein
MFHFLAGGDMELYESRVRGDREVPRGIAIEQHRRSAKIDDQVVAVPVASMADIAGEEIEITTRPKWDRNEPCFCGSEKPVHDCHGIAIY